VRPPSPEHLYYDDIRNAASTFRREFWPSGKIPVDIEEIVDVGLGIDIVPELEYLDDSGMDGLLSHDRRTIWVGDIDYHYEGNRYRFTLAHEVGHWYLHEHLYVAADFSSLEEWGAFVRSIPPEDYMWYEWQASAFAGLLLVPKEPFAEWITRAKDKALNQGVELDFDFEAHCEHVAEYVAKQFAVSSQVILKRGYYDRVWRYK